MWLYLTIKVPAQQTKAPSTYYITHKKHVKMAGKF